MKLIDTHCHLDVEEFAADREEVLARCKEVGVTRLVVPAVLAATWTHLLDFCARHQGLYPALGMHPIYLEHHRPEHVAMLEQHIKQYRPVAVGEIGLDYFVAGLDPEKQKALFSAQLLVAREAELPVILHVRKAHDHVLMVLKKHRIAGGICHAFNGSLQQAQQYLDLGFKLGFGGMLTYERSNHLRRLAVELPLDAIVLETDAPDMTVASHRGERNSPEYLPECLAVLAELRGEAPEDVAAQTTANALAVLNIH
jgi:TatD DNase family protein